MRALRPAAIAAFLLVSAVAVFAPWRSHLPTATAAPDAPLPVVGSRGKLRFEVRDGNPVLLKLPEVDHIDDGPGKPVGVQQVIGRRPVAAFGNSDGDLQMLQWTTAGAGARFALLVHHTDEQREWAYDRHSPIGRLDKALDEARAKGWTVVDMRTDWTSVFATR